MATVNERVRVDFGTVASVIVLERSDVVTLEHPLPLYVSFVSSLFISIHHVLDVLPGCFVF